MAVDAVAPGAEAVSNQIPNLDCPTQWEMAVALLDRLRRAEVVYTSRLHIALPCLAFGTPVVFPAAALRRAAGGGADEEDAQAGVGLAGFRGGGDRGYSRFLGSAHEGFVEG